jgi:hypothetical protein
LHSSRLPLKSIIRISRTGYPPTEYSVSMHPVDAPRRQHDSGYCYRWRLPGKPFVTGRTKNNTGETCTSKKNPSVAQKEEFQPYNCFTMRFHRPHRARRAKRRTRIQRFAYWIVCALPPNSYAPHERGCIRHSGECISSKRFTCRRYQ